jgi:hypothetical protein
MLSDQDGKERLMQVITGITGAKSWKRELRKQRKDVISSLRVAIETENVQERRG